MEDRDFVAEAKKDGWVPKEEFKGKSEDWKDAEQFVRDGENILPIVKKKLTDVAAANENLKGQLNDTKTKMEEIKQTVAEFRDYHKKTVQETREKAYKEAIRDLQGKQREKVESGDTEGYDAITREIQKLQDDRIDDTVDFVPQEPQERPEYRPWLEKNPWYGTNKQMSDYAMSVRDFVYNNNPGIAPGDFYEKITEEVKKRFPEEFEPAPAQQTVEGGNNSDGKKKKKGYDNLPSDAKKICDKYVEEGLLTKKQFIEDFDWESE